MKRIAIALRKLDRGKGGVRAAFVLCAAAIAVPAQTFTTLHRFDGADGFQPAVSTQATDGNLYGTAFFGGANCAPTGCGTVFRITPSGTLTTLYNLCSQSGCTDGSGPEGLVQVPNGDFYGTTYYGGANYSPPEVYGGTVFKITPQGALTTLYSFCSQSSCMDGELPMGGLVRATNGELYGTTYAGGASAYPCFSNVEGCGTVFKITLSGTLTTLHIFAGYPTDGGAPTAGLVQAANGDLYGTTAEGGASNNGTVFKITPSGTLTVLYSFCSQSSCVDGAGPGASLVQATNGDLYGTTQGGGASNDGTVFKITPSGTLTTLYTFCSPGGCPVKPIPSALIQATDGNFYGTTYNGGDHCTPAGCGTVFKITPGGTLATLHSFCAQSGCTDGSSPEGLVQDTNGTFYGTTGFGGVAHSCTPSAPGCGTAFSLATGLGPFVKTLPTSGKVGTSVKILGTNLTGATGVTFNGTPAAFTINSSGTTISTIVPAGAVTGKVQLVIPSGTLSSNVPFRVLP